MYSNTIFRNLTSSSEIEFLYWFHRDEIRGSVASTIIENIFTPNRVIYDIMVKNGNTWWSKEASLKLEEKGILEHYKDKMENYLHDDSVDDDSEVIVVNFPRNL